MSGEKKIKKGARVRVRREAMAKWAASLHARVGVVVKVKRGDIGCSVQFRHRAKPTYIWKADLEVV